MVLQNNLSLFTNVFTNPSDLLSSVVQMFFFKDILATLFHMKIVSLKMTEKSTIIIIIKVGPLSANSDRFELH